MTDLEQKLNDLLGGTKNPAKQVPVYKTLLGVDSGQMAVLALQEHLDPGFSSCIHTSARAGQTFKAWSVVKEGRVQALVVADVLHSEGLFVDYSDEVTLNLIGEFSFEAATPLFVCDPCYFRGPQGRQSSVYDTICALPSTGGLVQAEGKTYGVSVGTCYGDGTYEAVYTLHSDGALKALKVPFNDDDADLDDDFDDDDFDDEWGDDLDPENLD